MESLKRTKTDFLGCQTSSFISPFHKDSHYILRPILFSYYFIFKKAKLEESKFPGENYFNYINKGEEVEKEVIGFKKPSRNERVNKIEKAQKKFANFFIMVKQHDLSDFVTRREEIFSKMKAYQEIPNVKNVEDVHKEYCLSEKFRKNYKNKNWNEIELKLLIFTLVIYSCIDKKPIEEFCEETWNDISKIFTNKNGQICRFKYNAMLRSHPTVSSWTPEEDEFLRQIVSEIKEEERYRIKWTQIAIKLNKMTSNIRVGKHCRERWLNHLNPILKKGSWSPEEDIILLEKTVKLGKKWAKISRELPGRNENSVKNRFITLTKDIKVKGRKKSEKYIKDPNFLKEIHVLILSLQNQMDGSTLNKSLEKLDLGSPLNPTSPIDHSQRMMFEPPLAKAMEDESTKDMDSNYFSKNSDQQQNNLNNYLLFLQFLNSQVISPTPNLEEEYQEIQKEIQGLNQKDLNISSLHFTSSVDQRRGSSNTESRLPGSKRTSNSYTESKRPSNSFTSLYLTPSIVSYDNEEILKSMKCPEQEPTNFINIFPALPKPKNKNKKLMNLIIEEIKENNTTGEQNINFSSSLTDAFPTPIISHSNHINSSPFNPLAYNQDCFRFSPQLDYSHDRKNLSPIMKMQRVEEIHSPMMDCFIKSFK